MNLSKGGGAGGAISLIILLVVAVLVWGFIGGQQAQDPGITCDMGAGDSLCWQWHKNKLGEAREFAEDVGDQLNEFFGG